MARRFYHQVETFRDRPFLVGLDTRFSYVPPDMQRGNNVGQALFCFNRAIIDATHGLCAGFKINLAFYLEHDDCGLWALRATLDYIRKVAPISLVVLDAKFGDVHHTNARYVEGFLGSEGFDAVTVTPYVGGDDSLHPFLRATDKGIIIVCRTSDLSQENLQTQQIMHTKKVAEDWLDRLGLEWFQLYETAIRQGYLLSVYRWVAAMTAAHWNDGENCGLVMAAQHPSDARAVRTIVGDFVPFLGPGVGTQGGDVRATVRASRNSQGGGFVLTSSSDIIDPGEATDVGEAARRKTHAFAAEIAAAKR